VSKVEGTVVENIPGFKDGVKVIPGGSKPPTPKNPLDQLNRFGTQIFGEKAPAQINSSKGGTDKGPNVEGLKKGQYYGYEKVDPEGRPKPNQGTRVPGAGMKPPVTIGGERPGAVPITGPNPTIPKTPGRIASFFGGMRGGSGGGGGLFGIKNK
jgi:hypothetical protein